MMGVLVVGNPPPGQITLTFPGLLLSANVTLTSPGGDTSVARLTAGFLQNLTVRQLSIGYSTPTVFATPKGVSFNVPYWDAIDFNSGKWYANTTNFKGAFYVGSKNASTHKISTEDTPHYAPLLRNPTGQQLSAIKIQWDLTMYIAAQTDEQPQAYVGEAYATWGFNGTGVYKGPNGLGFGPPWTAGPNPVAKVTPPKTQWLAVTANGPKPVINTTKFNNLPVRL
jgi:hypothetical protein